MKHGKIKNYHIVRYVPLAISVIVLAVLAIYLIVNGETFSVDMILNSTPQNKALSVLFIMLVYAVKSLTIVFPILILQVAVGLVFPTKFALLVNLAGLIISLIIPYFVGRVSGAEAMDSLRVKYPKIDKFLNSDSKDSGFLLFFLRVIYCLPGDVISMYFGTVKTPFWKYFFFSMLGMLPGTILSTIIGASVNDPTSPMFLVSLSIIIALSVISIIIYSKWKKNKESNENIKEN